jgi:hypothetical protein
MTSVRINALTEDTSLVATDWLVAEVGDSEARKVSVTTLAAAVAVFVGVKVYSDATQAVNNTQAALTFNQEEYDSDGFHDTVTNNSRITIPTGKGGKYLLQGGAFQTGANGNFICFRLNGSTLIRGAHSMTGTAYWQVQTAVALVAGDYVEFIADTTSAGSPNGTFGHASLPDAQKWFAAVRLGA